MAPGYLNLQWDTTGTWGSLQNTATYVSFVGRTFTRLWENFRERDRYELARIDRARLTPTRRLSMFALPRVRMYVLRINSAGRPGRRRRRLAVATA